MTLVKTKRNSIISRFKNKEVRYPYFFYEEDPYEVEYSKFVDDECYSDDNVTWYYITDENSIKGICALVEQNDEVWIKFLEISTTVRGQGWGSEFIDYIIENTNKRIIQLYPKDTELGNNFYKQFGFKWFGNSEMYYLNWGESPDAAK